MTDEKIREIPSSLRSSAQSQELVSPEKLFPETESENQDLPELKSPEQLFKDKEPPKDIKLKSPDRLFGRKRNSKSASLKNKDAKNSNK